LILKQVYLANEILKDFGTIKESKCRRSKERFKKSFKKNLQVKLKVDGSESLVRYVICLELVGIIRNKDGYFTNQNEEDEFLISKLNILEKDFSKDSELSEKKIST
jgi:hypothetical protein